MRNTLAYYDVTRLNTLILFVSISVTKKKSFMTLTLGAYILRSVLTGVHPKGRLLAMPANIKPVK